MKGWRIGVGVGLWGAVGEGGEGEVIGVDGACKIFEVSIVYDEIPGMC